MSKKTNFSKLSMRDLARLDSKGDARSKRIRPSVAGARPLGDDDLDAVVGGTLAGGTAGNVSKPPKGTNS